jgi:hypothetical protein
LFAAIAFYIKLCSDDLFNGPYIVISDMPFIGPGMYRNAIGAKPLGIYSRFYYIRVITTAAIAQRGKFVDVYTKLCHAQN